MYEVLGSTPVMKGKKKEYGILNNHTREEGKFKVVRAVSGQAQGRKQEPMGYFKQNEI